MNIYCSSWLSSRFPTTIDGFKHAHQHHCFRLPFSGTFFLHSYHTEESGTFFLQIYPYHTEESGTFFLHSKNLASDSHWLECRSTYRYRTPFSFTGTEEEQHRTRSIFWKHDQWLMLTITMMRMWGEPTPYRSSAAVGRATSLYNGRGQS
jgi:hypothetical protein